MMYAYGINKTATKTAAPRLQVEDPFDKSFRPEELEHCVHLIRELGDDEQFCPESNEKESSSEWEVDLAAFTEVELDSLLSAMSYKHSSMRTEGTLQSVGQAAMNTDTDQHSMVSEDANDEHSWVMGSPSAEEEEEVDWEVISDEDSVISLVSNAAICWTYKDALTLGKGSEAIDRDTCSESYLNLQPNVDIQLRSSSKCQTSCTDEEFDADFFRDGVKMGRGGRAARMFKGNYLKKKQTKVLTPPA